MIARKRTHRYPRGFLSIAAAQIDFQVFSRNLFHIENRVSSLPKQVRAHQIEDGAIVVRIKSCQIERHGNVELFEQGKRLLIKIESSVIESQGYGPLRQFVCIKPLNCLIEREDIAARLSELLQTQAKNFRRHVLSVVPEMLVVQRDPVIGENQEAPSSPATVVHQRRDTDRL